jgi:SET domain-containing protein
MLNVKFQYLNETPVISLSNVAIRPFTFCNTLICNKEIPTFSLTLALSLSSYCLQYYENQGHGLLCHKSIKQGEYLLPYYGELISTCETNQRLQSYKREGLNTYILTIKEHVSDDMVIVTNVDATQYGGIARFVNHSCDPNCKIAMIRTDTNIVGIPVLMSLRHIPKGEQLTFNYAEGQEDDDVNNCNDDDYLTKRKRMRSYKYSLSKTKCNCNTNLCRGYLPSYH